MHGEGTYGTSAAKHSKRLGWALSLLLKAVINILMEGTPSHIDVEDMLAADAGRYCRA